MKLKKSVQFIRKLLNDLLRKFKNLFISGLKPHSRPFILKPETGGDIWHRAFIEHLAFLMKPKIYVELGIRDCSVINRMIPHAEKVIGVDIDIKAGEFLIKSSKAEFVCSSTLDFAKQLQAEPINIDMLFIDADHACEAVLSDFWNLFPFVSPHGLILLHDTHPKDNEAMSPMFCNNAYEVINKIKLASEMLEYVTLPFHPGLTIIRKRKTQLAWMEKLE
jgi:predicted O-methyltransferase YrrM